MTYREPRSLNEGLVFLRQPSITYMVWRVFPVAESLLQVSTVTSFLVYGWVGAWRPNIKNQTFPGNPGENQGLIIPKKFLNVRQKLGTSKESC